VFATSTEIESQPALWRRAAAMVDSVADALPAPGERIAVIGCGTSFYMAQAFAALREGAGLGTSDAAVPSELSPRRRYDRIVAISRSGTTSEVVRALEDLDGVPTVAITAVRDGPIGRAASQTVVLDFADEASVVQTRFATTTLALLRAHVAHDIEAAATEGERALEEKLPADPSDFEQFVFLGHGWTVGVAHESALKLREAARAWTESYPAMEYRHGPISVAGPRTLVWAIGRVDRGVLDDAAETEATIVAGDLDPMAELILVQRTAVELARNRGFDPDRPRHLARSVVLP
jgi:fructoselysine-6-P-deglycase FrlB-like protein